MRWSVCLAVWLSFAARSATDKVLGVLWPVMAFVALGLEHSVANMFLLPLGWLCRGLGLVAWGRLPTRRVAEAGPVRLVETGCWPTRWPQHKAFSISNISSSVY